MKLASWLSTTPGQRRPALGLVLIALCAGRSRAGDVYVSTKGDDANTCRLAAAPCRTIQAAVAKAGTQDIVHVAAGEYYESITLSKRASIRGADAATTWVNAAMSLPVWP